MENYRVTRRQSLFGFGAVATAIGGLWTTTESAAAMRAWPLADCRSLVINVPCSLRVELSSKAQLQVNAEAHVLSALTVALSGGVATLESPQGFNSKQAVVVVATLPVLERLSLKAAVQGVLATMKLDRLALDLNGSSGINLEDLRAVELKARVRGASSVIGKGEVQNQIYIIDGAGSVLARKLRGNQVRVAISGAGSAEVAARDELYADISGVGSVGYEGRPKLFKNLQGIASVDPL